MNIVQRFLISNATNQPLGETGNAVNGVWENDWNSVKLRLDTPVKALVAGLIGGAVLLTIAGAWHK